MRNVFRKGYREFEFMNSRETRFVEFKDRFQAMEFLREFLHDSGSMNRLRRLLEREVYRVNLSAVTDYGVLEQIADMLASRRIRVVERYDLFEAGFHTYAGIEAAEAAAEPEPEFIDEPETAYEPEEPPPMPDPAAQAAALERAAAAGTPFCEA